MAGLDPKCQALPRNSKSCPEMSGLAPTWRASPERSGLTPNYWYQVPLNFKPCAIVRPCLTLWMGVVEHGVWVSTLFFFFSQPGPWALN